MKSMKGVLFLAAMVCFALVFRAGGAALAEGVTYLDENGQTQTCASYTPVTADIASSLTGWYAVTENVTINNTRLEVSGEAHLILCDGATLTVPKGIQVSSGNSLTVYAQSTGSGKGALTVKGVAQYNAGIGGNNNENGGTVTINGGTVTVTGGQYGAGIGGGYQGDGGTVTINGGTVTVTGGQHGAGIGGGCKSDSGGIITINGGTVKATGGNSATGIGGGGLGGGGTVTINGGNVEANSGKDEYNERIVGIGGGYKCYGGTLTVDFSSASDSLKASSYGGTVTVANHKFLTDGNGICYAGALTNNEKSAIAGKTLQKTDAAQFILINAAENGSVTASAKAALPDTQITLTVTPHAGYAPSFLTYTYTPQDGAETIEDISFTKDETTGTYTGSFTMPNSHVTVSAAFVLPYLDANGQSQICETCTSLTADTPTAWGSGWYMAVPKTLTIGERVTVSGNVHLILRDGATLTVTGGINVSDGNSLTIYAQSTGSTKGALTVKGVAEFNAGIGGNNGESCGTVTINGGTVNVKSGDGGAGIGGGYGGAGGTVTINGGTVTATGGYSGAGIGGGYNGAGGNITVNGGTVTATGGDSGAGIGGGFFGTGGAITVNGGDITANGGEYGAGIGSGYNQAGGNITVNGGDITANGGEYGAGIGGGYGRAGGNITVTGGTVTATGGENGAGIGGGRMGAGGTITISGGTVTATGGDSAAGIGSGYNRYGGTLTVGFSSASASLKASSYGCAVQVANGKILSFTDDDSVTHYYAGELTNDEKSAIAGQTLQKNSAAYIIYKSVTGQGTVTSSPSAALAETPVTLTAAPAAGCVLMSLTYAYTPVGGTETIVAIDAAKDEETGIYTGSFTLPAAHVTVNAVFGSTVTLPGSIAHGSLSASAGGAPLAAGGLAPVGEPVTLTLVPDAGYLPDSLTYTYTSAGGEATTGTVTCAKDEDTGNYTGSFSMPAADVTVTASFAPDPAHFSVNDAETEYTIHTAAGWDVFCDCMQDEGAWSCFSGKTVKLGASITVDRMVDSDKPFRGTFDGQGHTLTFNYSGSEDFIAPFPYTTWSTTPVFRNLTVSGTINTTGSYAAGFIGHLYGEVTIENCASNVDITSAGGSGGFVGLCEHTVHFTDCVSSTVIHSTGGNNSGFVGWSRASGHEISFAGCIFNGKLLQKDGSGGSNGGFIGWTGSNKTVTINNSLFAPAALASGETMADGNSATFARGWNGTTTAANSYYTTAFGTAQGEPMGELTLPEGVTASVGAYTQGGKTWYYPGKTVTLTVAPPEGYTLESLSYTPEGGEAVELTPDENGAYTFTVSGGGVTVSAAFKAAFGPADFVLPAALAQVEENAFRGISAVCVDVPEACVSIGDSAFAYCPNLAQIRIPNVNCALGENVFAGCEAVTVFAPAGSPAQAYAEAHDNCEFVDYPSAPSGHLP